MYFTARNCKWSGQPIQCWREHATPRAHLQSFNSLKQRLHKKVLLFYNGLLNGVVCLPPSCKLFSRSTPSPTQQPMDWGSRQRQNAVGVILLEISRDCKDTQWPEVNEVDCHFELLVYKQVSDIPNGGLSFVLVNWTIMTDLKITYCSNRQRFYWGLIIINGVN